MHVSVHQLSSPQPVRYHLFCSCLSEWCWFLLIQSRPGPPRAFRRFPAYEIQQQIFIAKTLQDWKCNLPLKTHIISKEFPVPFRLQTWWSCKLTGTISVQQMENISVRTSLLQWACALGLCLMLLMFQLQHNFKFARRTLYRKRLSKDSGAAPVYSSLPIMSKFRPYFTKRIVLCMSPLCSARLNIYFSVLLKFFLQSPNFSYAVISSFDSFSVFSHLFCWLFGKLTASDCSSVANMHFTLLPRHHDTPVCTILLSHLSPRFEVIRAQATSLSFEGKRGVYLELLVISSPVWNNSLTFWLRALCGTLQWMWHFLSKWIVAVTGSAGLGVPLQLTASLDKQFSLGDYPGLSRSQNKNPILQK